MKLTVSFLAFIFASVVYSVGTEPSPVEYINQLNEDYRVLNKEMWSYTSAVANDKSARKIEKRRTQLLNSLKAASKKVAKADGYNGNTTYRDTMLLFLDLSYDIINEDYAKIVDMEAVAEQSYDAMEAYLLAQDMANAKMKRAGDMVQKQLEVFAEEHNITLNEEETKLGKKMAIASKAFKYNRQLYLLFFKGYVQELYISDAMNRQDVSALEQNSEALKMFSEESLEKLKDIEAYDSDNSLKEATKKALDLMNTQASEYYPTVTSFYLAQEKFNKIKTSFDAKKQKDRTQEDVDEFNKAVGEVNAASEAYNAALQKINESNQKITETFNKASTKFLKKHVPN